MKKADFFQRWVAYLIDTVVFWGLAFLFHSGLLGIAWILYETVSVARWGGHTVGKKIMGIRVVSVSGVPMDGTKALVRTIGKILSYMVFLLGFLWMLWDKDSQTWHDKLADTYVVVS